MYVCMKLGSGDVVDRRALGHTNGVFPTAPVKPFTAREVKCLADTVAWRRNTECMVVVEWEKV